MQLEKLMQQVISLAEDTADFLRTESRKLSEIQVEEKGLHNLVSYVDREAEQQIKDGLLSLLPGSGFIAEESGSQIEARYNWIIDPLDGTTNFLHAVPLYSISIALKENDEIILGLVLEVGRDECFYSYRSAPCFLNGKEIRVSPQKVLDKSLLATGFPYHDFSRMDFYLKLFEQLMRRTRGVRRMGSAAVDLAYVAAGRFEAFYEYGLNPWDIAAGMFLVKQAGGEVSTFAGTDEVLFGNDIIASNGLIHHALLEEVAAARGN